MPTTTGVVPDDPAGAPDDGTTTGSLTELAALEAARDEKRRLLESRPRRRRAALGRTPRCRPGCAPRTSRPAAPLLRSEPAAEVVGQEPARARRPRRRPPDGRRHRPPGAAWSTCSAPATARGPPAGHRRHAVPGRLGHRRGRPAGRGARARRAPGLVVRRDPRRAPGLLRQRRAAELRRRTRSPSPGWPSCSTARWTTRPPRTWSRACAACSPTSARPRGRRRLAARRSSSPSELDEPAAGRAGDGAPGRRPGGGRGAAALAGRRQLHLPRLPRRRADAATAGPPCAPCPAPGSGCCAATPTRARRAPAAGGRPGRPAQHLLIVTKANTRATVHRPA